MKNDSQSDFNELRECDAFTAVQCPRKRAFLAAYQICGSVVKAAELAGVARRNHPNWMALDEVYRRAFYASRDRVCDHIEGGLIERLAHGWLEPVFHKGEQVGHRRRFDNAVCLRYLERVNPKVFSSQSEQADNSMQPIDLEDIKIRLNAGQPVSQNEAGLVQTLLAMKDSVSRPESGKVENGSEAANGQTIR